MTARTSQDDLAPAFPLDPENTETEQELTPTYLENSLSAEDLAELSVMYAADQAERTRDAEQAVEIHAAGCLPVHERSLRRVEAECA